MFYFLVKLLLEEVVWNGKVVIYFYKDVEDDNDWSVDIFIFLYE